MHQYRLVLTAIALAACSEPVGPGPGGAVLTSTELSRARGVAPYGDAAAAFRGRTYTGTFGAEINATGETVRLRLIALADESPPTSIGGEIPVPASLARTLAASGWDFTLQLHDDLVYGDPQLHGYLGGDVEDGFFPTSLRIRAEPNGLFVATIELAHADGRGELVELYGRLTAGCAVFRGTSEGGTFEVVADPSSIPLCDDIMREL